MTTNLTAEDSVKRIRVSKIEFEGRAPYLPDSRQTAQVTSSAVKTGRFLKL